MRGTINTMIEAFATERGFGFAADVVPSGLLNEKYPCIFCILPDATYDAVRMRWTYPTTIYLVAMKGKAQTADSIIDDLQTMARDLFLILRQGCTMYTDKTMNVKPKTLLDNTGAVALEMVLNIYESDECR